MADNNRTFIQRVISGFLAAILALGVATYGGTRGLQLLITVAVVLAIREFIRMAFAHWPVPKIVTHVYWTICAGLYALLVLDFQQPLLLLMLAMVAFMFFTLWLSRGKVSNDLLLGAVAMGAFGLIYCVMFPYFALRMVLLENGANWFLFLLLVVFFGDTFAYFGGRWLGRTKLMPEVSPNKTWEGAAAGLLGSVLAGTVHAGSVFQDVALWKTALFCLLCGAVAQSGDLLISLVKRVAHVKDSGHIMPGHGGVLDRMDGIFIACPLIYAFALWVRPI